jgi:signal transduction histidine kinase
VCLTLEDSRLRVEVRDDGVGGADPSTGSGLLGLRDRVEALDGRLEVDSPPGAGTTVVVEMRADHG